jgi:tetratricopeptide (TPR) repeat protein
MSSRNDGPSRGDELRARADPQAAAAIKAKLQQALALHRQGRLTAAEALYREVLLLAPANCDALHLLGSIEIEKGNFLEAVKLIEKAIRSFPNVAGLHSNRGLALQGLKRLNEALDSYEKALSIDPNFVEGLFNRANALLEMGRLQEALASYDKVLWIQPNHVDALFNRSTALKDLNRINEAIAGYDKALSIKPDFAKALYNRGSALALLKQYEGAAKSFAECLRVSPYHDYALGNMFDAQLHACDWSQYRQLTKDINNAVARGMRVTLPFTFLAYATGPRRPIAVFGDFCRRQISRGPRTALAGQALSS